MRKIYTLLQSIPKPYLASGILAFDILVLYLDIVTGPRIPFTIFYVLLIFLSLKYVDSRFGYAVVLFTVLGKMYVKSVTHPDTPALQELWQFTSSLILYSTLCYLLDAQMRRRKQAEVALDDLSKLHRSIIAETDSGVMVFRADGTCILANEAAVAIKGGSPEQIRTSNFRDIPSWQESGLLVAAEEVLRTGVTQRVNTPIHTSYGKTIWCIVSFGRIDRESAPPYLLAVFADITAYREAVQAMQQANKNAEIALDRANLAERRIINISEETQQRVGRELHDDLGQHLTGIAFMSEVLRKHLDRQDHPGTKDASRITDLVNEAISKTRRLAHGLYPVEMKEAGLSAMLRNLACNAEETYRIKCEFICEEECEIDDPLAVINLFRICQEAVNNAAKHSGATKITLKLEIRQSIAHVEVSDNGCGMDEFSASGLGMHTMKYRASLLGTALRIRTLPGGGTSVAVSLVPQQDVHAHAI
jgi:PAS domain S-box-containing protein